MDKHKLVQIILKDLEELKTLAEEVAESQRDSALIIELALNRAKLLCQEIELLREVTVPAVPFNDETLEDLLEEDENEVSDLNFSDPELEIINFEERDFPEDEEVANEETIVFNADEQESEEEDQNEDLAVELEEEDLIEEDFEGTEDKDKVTEMVEEKDDNQDEEAEETDDEEVEEDDLTDDEEDEEIEEVETDEDEDKEDEDTEIEEDDSEEEFQQKINFQDTELKTNPQPGVREIHIEDLDDEEDDSIQFSPGSATTYRQVMHEIPKPENQVQEKQVFGESFQKERSLNDVIGENKSSESKLANGPISSLRAAIGLNDRFLFIREIFDNNTEKYNKIIEQLDKLETIQEAVDYLKANLTLQKNDTSLKFVDLLKRRFSK